MRLQLYVTGKLPVYTVSTCPTRHLAPCSPTLLRNFCEEESLVNANMHTKANIDYTYCNYASGATSIIDHFLLTEQAYDSISNVHVVHSGTNLSDHDPIILQMLAPHLKMKTSNECRSKKVKP